MPLYEFECLECGVHFERLQRFGAPSPDTCPQGHRRVHRLLSQPTVIFKGSGFYVTDNKGNGHKRGRNGQPSKKTSTAAAEKGEASSS